MLTISAQQQYLNGVQRRVWGQNFFFFSKKKREGGEKKKSFAVSAEKGKIKEKEKGNIPNTRIFEKISDTWLEIVIIPYEKKEREEKFD